MRRYEVTFRIAQTVILVTLVYALSQCKAIEKAAVETSESMFWLRDDIARCLREKSVSAELVR